MDLKETDILGADIVDHWYYSAKARAMSRLLGEIVPGRILDVGAGSGFFSRYLLAHTPATEAWCVDISYETDEDDTVAGGGVHCRRAIGAVDADLVLMMDVLEHVEDDVALLREYASKVPRHSRFLISVPAFDFLRSGHDEFLGHRRRYTLAQLEAAVSKAGLVVKRDCYYFGMVFPIAAVLRLAERAGHGKPVVRSQLTKHHPIVNSLLKLLCQIELPFMSINRVAGLTVFCLAEKG